MVMIFDVLIKNRNSDKTALGRDLFVNLGETTINQALIGVLCNTDYQYIFGKQRLSKVILSTPKLDSRSSMLMSIIS